MGDYAERSHSISRHHTIYLVIGMYYLLIDCQTGISFVKLVNYNSKGSLFTHFNSIELALQYTCSRV